MFHNTMFTMLSLLLILMSWTSHPLSLGLTLMMMAFFASLYSSLMTLNGWIGYMLFLVFVGGLLVLFMYVINLANNEMFSTSFFNLLFISSIWIGLMISFYYCSTSFFLLDVNETLDLLSSSPATFNPTYTLSKLYQSPMNLIVLFLACYLLLVLLIVAFIIELDSGPLRSS